MGIDVKPDVEAMLAELREEGWIGEGPEEPDTDPDTDPDGGERIAAK